MGLSRATKTFTGTPMQLIAKDSYVDEASSASNFGLDAFLYAVGLLGSDARRAYLTFALPPAPSDADTSIANAGILSVVLKVYLDSWTAGTSDPTLLESRSIKEAEAGWGETSITWANQPSLGYQFATGVSIGLVAGYKDFDVTDFVTAFGKRWGNDCPVMLKTQGSGQAAHWLKFRSRDYLSDATSEPKIVVQYYQKPPAQITDLAIVPDADDVTRPKLTWTPSKDELFSKYQVFRKVGGGAYAQVGSDVTVQGQGSYVDTGGGLTENNVIYYKIREVNVDGSYNESNEVWMVRPDVSTFTFSDTTPDVNQKVTATVGPAAITTTPTPVTNTDYYYQWGAGSESDLSSGWSKTTTRPHIYAYAGSQTPKAQIRNSQGFASDLTGLTSGGPTLTIASIAPVAKIKAAPMSQETNVNVTFFGDESYAPAANKTIAAANGYEWDWDYTGVFAADLVTNAPTATHSWPSAGDKTSALRVKDVDGTYSTAASIDVAISAPVTVNLDALTDGFEVLDHERSRQTMVYEGVDTFEVARGALRPQTVRIGGFAFTDADADNIPNDIETIIDVLANNKKVQLTVLGTVRTGTARGLPVHTEGGWDFKYNWSLEVVLDP